MNIVLGSHRCKFSRLHYIIMYLGMMHIVAFMNMFMAGNQVNTLIIDGIAIYSLIITVKFVGNKFISQSAKFSILDIGVLLFLFFSVSSLVLYFQHSNPAAINAYVYGIHLLILPMLLYFTAKGLDADDQDKLLNFILFLHISLVGIGLAMFFVRPDFYTEYLRENLASRNATELWQLYARLQSYLGSTSTGILSAISIVLLATTRIRPFPKYTLLILLLLAVLLTQQRGAYLSATVATLFFFFHSNISIRYLLVAIIIFFLGATFLIRSDKDIIESLVDYTANRISEDLIGGDAYSERAVSYRKALTLQGEFPFGMGIGATTSAADASGANPGGQVVDANYMRILVDLGAIGLYLFLAVLTFGARSVIVRHRSKAFIVILFIYAFQATGTNIFDSYYVTHLFWLFLGIIDTPLSRV